MLDQLLERINKNRLRLLEGTAIGAATADILSTYVMVGSAQATELNPISGAIISEHGWTAYALVYLLVVTAVFGGLQYYRDQLDKWAYRTGALGAGLLTVNAVYVAHLALTNLPDSLPVATPEMVGGVIATAILLRLRPDPRLLIRAWTGLSADTRARVSAISMSVVIITSVLSGFVMMSGTASATSSGSDIVVTGDDSGDITAFNRSDGSTVWSTVSAGGSNVDGVTVDTEGNVYASSTDGTAHYVEKIDISGTQQWNLTVHDSNYPGEYEGEYIDYHNDGQVFVLTSDEVLKINASDGSILKNISHSSEDVIAVNENGDRVFVGDSDDDSVDVFDLDLNLIQTISVTDGVGSQMDSDENDNVYISTSTRSEVTAYDSSGSKLWNSSFSSTSIERGLYVSPDGSEVIHAGNDGLTRLDTADGTMINQYTGITGDNIYSGAMGIDGYLYAGDAGNSLTSIQQDGSQRWSSGAFGTITTIDFTAVKGTELVDGVVKDQSGAPVPNATVELWGVSKSVTHPQEELDSVSDPRPPEWDSGLAITGSGGVLDSADTEVALAYSPEDIGETAWVDGANLKDTGVTVPANDQVALVVWDPTKDPGWWDGSNEYNQQLPGAQSSGTVVIEKLSPSGEVTQTITRETSNTAGGGWGDPSSLDYADVTLNPGFYKVYPEGSPESGYVIVAGGVDAVTDSVRDSLEDIDGQATERAQEVSQKVRDGTFTRVTVTTDSNGQFSADVPQDYTVVGVQAYKYGGLLENVSVSDRSMDRGEDLMSTQNYSGQVYLPRGVEHVEPPASGVTVDTIGTSFSPHQNLSDYQRFWDQWQNYLENWTDAELPGVIQDELGDYNQTELADLKDELSRLHDENEELQQKYRKALAEERNKDPSEITVEIDDTSGSEDELREEISALQESIQSLESQVDASDEVSVSNETASYSVSLPQSALNPTGTDVTQDDIVVLAHYSDGTTETVNSSYVSVEDTQLTDGRTGDTIHVSEYPLPEDVSSARFEVIADTDDGIVRESESVENPQFDGVRPGVDSISISSLHPQAGGTVTLSMDPDDESAYDGLQSVNVVAPDGSAVNTSISNGEATIPVQQAGTHHVEVVYSNSGGHQFSEVFRFEARDETFSSSPSVRLKTGTNGEYALAAGMQDADIERKSDGGLDVFAEFKRDAPPGELHVYPSETLGSDGEVKMHVVEGDTQQAVNQRVIVNAHLGQLNDNAVIYRATDGTTQPVALDGNQYGKVITSENGTTIKTYTSDQGMVELRVNNDPGIVTRVQYRAELWLAKLPVDVGGLSPFHVGGFGGGVVLGGFIVVSRRRVRG